MSNRFECLYPSVNQWMQKHGSIEIGPDGTGRTLLRVRDGAGVRWERASYYPHFDDALSDAESAVAKLLGDEVGEAIRTVPAA